MELRLTEVMIVGSIALAIATRSTMYCALLAVLVVGLAVLRHERRGTEDPGSWSKGATGERVVGELVDTLVRQLRLHDDGPAVALHDVALPGWRANIDHVVISTRGVFTVNAKNYSPSRRLNHLGSGWAFGQHRVDVRTDRRLAAALSRHLDVDVSPLWAVLGPEIPKGFVEVDGVDIMNADRLHEHISRHPHVLRTSTAERCVTTAQLVLRDA